MKTVSLMMKHLFWANRQVVELLEKGEVQDPAALRLLRHMAVAEQVWLIRLNGGSTRHLTLWKDGVQSDIAAMMRDNERSYNQYLETLTEQKLDSIVTYTNQQGTPFETSVREIVTHVALHGQYHRGQFNRMMVSSAQKPLVFDYIAFARL
ncbi:DinB family protein [Paenibacillus sp. 1P07SE]|uniref:DinB family protein n=1 Tax=Paenibacillus sp. 1P07SE TaxID=3132209 RepID=UPI0039A64D03